MHKKTYSGRLPKNVFTAYWLLEKLYESPKVTKYPKGSNLINAILTHFPPMYFFLSHKNMRNGKVFWCFQG